MVDQQLLNWMRGASSKGHTSQQLRELLLQKGYTSDVVDEALAIVFGSKTDLSDSTRLEKKSHKLVISMVIGVILIGLIGAGIFLFGFQNEPVDINSTIDSDNLLAEKTNKPDLLPLVEEIEEVVIPEVVLLGCAVFPDKLVSCESFSCEFEHPFTGEMMNKEILGLVDGLCVYVEEMPAGGQMDCKYSESVRLAVAQYHGDIADSESFGTELNNQNELTYTVDGVEVENPLQEALDNGQCIISGY